MTFIRKRFTFDTHECNKYYMNKKLIWTNEEIEILKSNYTSNKFNDWIFLLPNRNKTSIKLKSNKLGLFRKTKGLDFITGNINRLLEDTHFSYYWMGFLLADGHFSKQNRLVLSLSIKDIKHLEKFKDFIEYKNNIRKDFIKCYLAVMDNFNIPILKNKFDIKSDKTYSPPNLNIFHNIGNELLLSLVIGFIDGDGAITNQSGRTDNTLRIKNHSSWLDILVYFYEIISRLSNVNFPVPKINKSGYAEFRCCNMNVLKFLKNHTIKYKLPVLERKWNKIDLNRISMYDTANERREKVIKLRNDGLTYKRICAIIGITKGRVSKILNERYN